MSERSGGPRRQEHEIIIDAPIEAVWKAIADGEELTRWFVEAAKVEPGVGGRVWVSWDGPVEGEGNPIEIWEPNQRLRIALRPFDMGPAKQEGQPPIIEDFTLERRDGKTVLRLVHSNIPNTPEWDGYYDGTDTGWQSFFRAMRHYLEHQAGKPRAVIKVVGKLPGSLEDSWARLTGPDGFGFEPRTGETFSTRTGAGDEIHGRVVYAVAPHALELSIRELGDALLSHSMAAAGPNQFVYSVLALYGKDASEVEAIGGKWQTWLSRVLGLETAGAAV